MANPGPSTSQVKKAGRVLRRRGRGDPVPDADYEAALSVLVAFRASHATPLITANNGLRSVLRTTGCTGQVSQRLKRLPTILDKLQREPTLDLSRMQDIGGVRAVVLGVEEIRRVEERLKKNRPVHHVSDYILEPRQSGYRGVHVVVEYGGRLIEVQLRTPVMHEWAITVEQLASRSNVHLKGDGDGPMHLLMAEISKAMALEEVGQVVPNDVLHRINELKMAARFPTTSGPTHE